MEYEKVKREVILYCNRQSLSKSRYNRYMQVLRLIKNLCIDVINLRDSEVDKFYFHIINSKYSEWTKLTLWKIFKKICRLFHPNFDFSKWRIKTPKTVPEILTLEEISNLIRCAETYRDKLIILLLYESGMRAGELLNLRKQDITFDENGAVLRIFGKTGVRYIRVIHSAKYLETYVKFHNQDRLFPITNAMLSKMLENCRKKAGIKKKVYPHLLRHTRATHLAKYLTEPELRLYFGWTEKSKMPSVYVHLSMRDVENKIIRISKDPNLKDLYILTTKQ